MGAGPTTTSSGASSQQNVAFAEPYGPARPLIDNYAIPQIARFADTPINYPPFDTFVPNSDSTNQGAYGLRNIGQEHAQQFQGPELLDESGEFLRNITAGKFGFDQSPAYGGFQNFAQGNTQAQQFLSSFLDSGGGAGNPAFPALESLLYGGGGAGPGGATPADVFPQLGGLGNVYEDYATRAADIAGDTFRQNTGQLASFYGDEISNPNVFENFRDLSRDFGATLEQQQRGIMLPAAEAAMNRYAQTALGYAGAYNQGQGLGINAAQSLGGFELAGLSNLDRGFDKDLGRQFQSASMAPGFATSEINFMNPLLRAGQITEGEDTRRLQADIDRFNFNETEPRNRFAQFLQQIMGVSTAFPTQLTSGTGTSNQTQETQNDPLSTILGTAGQLAPLAFFGGGPGTLVGSLF